MPANFSTTNSNDSLKHTMLEKPAKGIGETINDLWYLIFGGISQAAEKKRMNYAIQLENFKKELSEKVDKIPEDRRIEPSMQITMTALENAKYCAEEETLRSMFAELIASSIDAEKNKLIHPSFSEAIKNMTSLDAQNLLCFSYSGEIPVGLYRLKTKDIRGSINVLSPVFLANGRIDDLELQASSLNVLSQLGFVEIDFEHHFVDEQQYDAFSKTSFYKTLCWSLKNEDSFKRFITVEIKHGIAKLTAYGKRFIEVCYPDN